MLGHCEKNVTIGLPIRTTKLENIYLFENTNIYGYSKILISTAKFIMKKNSGAAQGLTVITGNHISEVGNWFKNTSPKKNIEKDVIVEEDVLIGANVTLLAGVTIGRGAVIGAGSVCRKNIPPYAIVMGNPAKIVGFKFLPDEIIEHEKILYCEDERFTKEVLTKNYEKYFLNKIDKINNYLL